MPLTSTSRRPWLTPAICALALAAGACSDSTGPDDDGHTEPAGLAAELGGETVASVNTAREVTGGFTIAAGDETDHIHVHFIDEDGEEIDIDESEYYLAIEVDDEDVVEVEQHVPGEFELHLIGVAAGTTNVRFKLMHGQYPDGHSDYTSPNIPVTVTGAT